MITMKSVVVGDQALKQVAAVQKAWKVALREERDEILRLYRKTYHNWGHKPAEQTTVKAGGGKMYAEVRLIGRIYYFVHESISVMRGVLSPDWSPKTQPRVLDSGAGSGRLLYASKKVSKPPYEAREFTQAIIEQERRPFQKRMEKATRDGVKAAP
jgi:hypothetical protein